MKMNAYKFPQYRSDSAVASGITLLVSVWFLVAGGAILSDPASPYTHRSEAHAAPLVHTADASPMAGSPISPDAHFRITVEARRGAIL
jgi:hypothetical protein